MNPDVTDSRTLQGATTADGLPAVRTQVQSVPEHCKYKMTHEHPGVALIFNQARFRNAPERQGSDKDEDDLTKALLVLRFKVRVYIDLTEQMVFETLKDVSKEDHSQHDCLVVVMMTHGETGTLLAADTHDTNRPPYKVERLWEHFADDACPGLVGKPKLVFIQACHRKHVNTGVKTRSKCVAKAIDARGSPEDRGEVYSIPTMPDLLVVYSTYDGHYSWRKRTSGSWFIQSLVRSLTKYGSTLDVLSLLTVVLRNVACGYKSRVPEYPYMDKKKQMPCIVSTLTKALYFR
ncbi:caspase-1-like [Anopheles bellator]|uniref:caspase-1-like n=1 Tax=Anopheles bellator TaxID=139047 RepID=UPI00264729F9|nr:caspase-1-like [Anopheles bellator]